MASNTIHLYRYLLRTIKKLPKEVQGYYKHHVKQGYNSHSDETDPKRIEQIIIRAKEDAEWIQKKTVGEIDDTEITLTRLFGFALMGTAVVWFLTRETYDGTVPITLMTARVFSCAVITMAQVYTQFGTTKGKKNLTWSEQHVYFGILGNFMWLFGNFYFLLRSHDFSTYPQFHIKINEFLRIDAMFSLLLSLMFLAFPDLVMKHFFPDLKVATCVDLHMLRCTGALLLNLAIISLQAPGFLHERDKRAHFTGRIVAHLLLFLPFIYGAVFNSQFTLRQIEWALLITLPLVINAVLGYLAGGTIMYRFKAKLNKE